MVADESPRASPAAQDVAEHQHALAELLGLVARHAGLLFEQVLHRARQEGIPHGGVSLASRDDVSRLLGSLRAAGPAATTVEPNPFRAPVEASRATLVERLAAPRAAAVGLAQICREFDLTGPLLDALVLALICDLDSRIATVFAYLNNDPQQSRPRLEHILWLFADGHDESLAHYGEIQRALLDRGLLQLGGMPDAPHQERPVAVPRHVLRLAMAFASEPGPTSPTANDLPGPPPAQLAATLEVIAAARTPRLLLVEGLPGSGRFASVVAWAQRRSLELLDLAAAPSKDPSADTDAWLAAACFRARAFRRVLVVRSDGFLRGRELIWERCVGLLRMLELPAVVLAHPDELDGVEWALPIVRARVPRPDPARRTEVVRAHLARLGLAMTEAALKDLVDRHEISPGNLRLVCERLAESGTGAAVDLRDVRPTLREVTIEKLSRQAKRHESALTLDDLVLAPDVRARLDELVWRVQYRTKVLDEWRFRRRIDEGDYGVSALFSGPSGTGKTAAAGAVANALQVDLYIVDLSRILSKWYGETEQNLARVFDSAETAGVALLFDEADALFGKRGSANSTDNQERVASATVNYLLHRLETYSGLVMLTTNRESSVDPAFMRRLTTRIFFPEPTADEQELLWRRLLPRGADLGAGVEVDELVAQYAMPGARIANSLVRAAFHAAGAALESPVLGAAEVVKATALEYEDMGRISTKNR